MDGYIDIDLCMRCIGANDERLFGRNDRWHGPHLHTRSECTNQRTLARCHRIFNHILAQRYVYAGIRGETDHTRYVLLRKRNNDSFSHIFAQNSRIFACILVASVAGVMCILVTIASIRGTLTSWQTQPWLPRSFYGVNEIANTSRYNFIDCILHHSFPCSFYTALHLWCSFVQPKCRQQVATADWSVPSFVHLFA